MKMKMLLPVIVENKTIPAELFVILWGLFNAGTVALTAAFVHILSVYTNPGELLPSPFELTDAEVVQRAVFSNVLWRGHIWCSVLQAAAGTLALLLVRHRRRTSRALAYVVLAASVVSHGMYASFPKGVPTSALGYFFIITTHAATLFYAMGDLLCFLALLVGGNK